MKKIVSGVIITSLFFLSGCSNKQQEISNQTALTWHRIIFKDLKSNNLDNADEAFTSLEVEHPQSNFIPTNLIELSLAHYYNNEFELAQYYMQEFKKRFASFKEKEWADYMISKYRFLSITAPYRNQKAVNEAIKFINSTINTYPNSIYNYELNTMLIKLTLTKKLFRNRISNLYQKLDKPKSAKIYKTDINNSKIIPPHIPWYKRLFYW